MSIYTYKCACKECGRILTVDTDAKTIVLNDFILDETFEEKSESISISNYNTVEVCGNSFVLSSIARPHFEKLLSEMKGVQNEINQ